MKNLSPKQLVNRLIAEEMDGSNARDMRRILRDARQKLQVTISSRDEDGRKGSRIAAAAREAHEIALMWGVDLPALAEAA